MTGWVKLTLIALLILLGTGGYFALRNIETTDNDLIRVASPSSNTLVTSPLNIIGEARGNWYFEASFPVKILDANGNLLGQHYAQAQGDWMTTEFVPFRASLAFAPSTTVTGTLILEKDNPSGLPENAAEVRIPVRFATVAASKTPIQDVVRSLLAQWNLPGVTLDAASLTSGVLTLTFSDPQHQTSGGSARVTMFRDQIEAAVKPYGVTSVKYKPDEVFQP